MVAHGVDRSGAAGGTGDPAFIDAADVNFDSLGIFNVKYPEFGARGDGVTDDTAAIRAAQAALEAAGGGILFFPPGTYLLSTIDTYTVRVPVIGATFVPDDEDHPYHVLIRNVSNIKWLGYGAKLKSSIANNAGEMVLLDGVRNFKVEGLEIESLTAKNGSGTVTTAGMNGFGFTSQTRDSYNIGFKNFVATNIYVPIYVFGDTASSFRVRGITVDNYRHNQGIYSLALHNNGDDVCVRGLQSIDTLREVFIFGAENWDIEAYSETGTAGFGSLIKAYDRDTMQGRLKLRTTKNISAPNVSVQSQHAPAVQATPKRVIGVEVDVNNSGTVGVGTAVGFDYYRDATLTATSSNNLFTGIKLKGIHEQAPAFTVAQNSASVARGTMNTDELVLLNGALYSIYNRTGFLDWKQTYNTFTPVLKINGSATGITYGGATLGEFWRDGQWIEAIYRIVLTNKGVSVGAVTLDLPVQSGNYNTGNAIVKGFGQANMAGLTSTITGYVQQSGTLAVLQDQGAAASVALDDTNLTNTSDFIVNIRYPL